jgi:hypothetical protein
MIHGLTGRSYDDLINSILVKHQPIQHHFFTQAWSWLQRLDSDIAERVMLKMLDEEDIPVLPLHDSFIVRAIFKDVLSKVMAQGACLQEGEDVAALLRGWGRNTVTIGILGSGPLVELAALREYGPATRPKTVFWFFYEGNDLQNIMSESAAPLLMRYLDDPDFTQDLINKQAVIDKALLEFVENEQSKENAKIDKGPMPFSHYIDRIFDYQLTKLYNLQNLRSLMGLSFRKQITPLMKQTLAIARDTVQSWGGELVFVNLPGWGRYASTFIQKGYNSKFNSNVNQIAKSLGLEVVEFNSVLGSQKDPLEFFEMRIHNHYTKEGYALLAGQLQEFLKKR